MHDLPTFERFLFLTVLVLYALAAAVASARLATGKNRQVALTHVIGVAVALEALLLAFRGSIAHALPLTDRFESLLVLSVAFGLVYLVLGVFFRQLWFVALMAWTLVGLTVLAAFTARAAEPAPAIVSRPWVIAHALVMVAGEATLLLASVAAGLYLLARRRLKRHQGPTALDAMPNLQRLERLNVSAMRLTFVLLSLGVVTGAGMAALRAQELERPLLAWLQDPRTMLFLAAWVITGATLAAQLVDHLTTRLRALATLLAFILLVASFLAGIALKTTHSFSANPDQAAETSPANPPGADS